MRIRPTRPTHHDQWMRGYFFGQAVGALVGIATCFVVLIATGSLR